jgi:hypothetical protein
MRKGNARWKYANRWQHRTDRNFLSWVVKHLSFKNLELLIPNWKNFVDTRSVVQGSFQKRKTLRLDLRNSDQNVWGYDYDTILTLVSSFFRSMVVSVCVLYINIGICLVFTGCSIL